MILTANKFLVLGAITAAALLASASQAQQVYRIVGPDGKVTFSDTPPVAGNAKVTAAAGSSGGGVASSSLPLELRQIAAKYPVSLYTGDNCAPCISARAMLTARGIPFVEKSVKTTEDSQALQRMSGDNTLPFATIGAQQLKGFSDSEWTQFLNAAGYPAVSILPPSYRNPSATPLVAISAAPSATTNAGSNGAAPPRPAVRPVQPPPEAGNPSGIRF